jgi:F-type H+-transporting ATPase subunit b
MTFFLGFAENSIQLVPDGTMLLHIVIILVMVFVLNATLFKPINRILQAREKRTRGRHGEAQGILDDVSAKLSDYEHKLRAGRAEAYALTERERAAALQERQKKVNEMRQQLAASVAQEKDVIREQADAARETLEVEAQRIAAEIGTRVLNRPVGGAQMN